MDINDARVIMTVLAFATFAGIVAWAYSGRRKAAFEEAAQLPFADDDEPIERTGGATKQGE